MNGYRDRRTLPSALSATMFTGTKRRKMLTKEIKLTQGQYAIVDADDYEGLNQWKWYAHKKKTEHTFYVDRFASIGRNKREMVSMHRLIMSLQNGDGKQVDHIDGNGLNNQRSNLRLCTRSQNNMNCRARKGTSKYKGVSWVKRDKRWLAKITHSGKLIYIGQFMCEDDAAFAYNKICKKLHGDFARLNLVK